MPQIKTATSRTNQLTKIVASTLLGALLAVGTVGSMYAYFGWRRDNRAIHSTQREIDDAEATSVSNADQDVTPADAINTVEQATGKITFISPTKDVNSALSQGRTPDINGDGEVDIFDVTILTSPTRWGTSDTTTDLNNDGLVDVYDLSLLLS